MNLINFITINLAPADVRKDGTGFDLPAAVGILAAQGLLDPEPLERHLFFGELSLDGRLKPTRGVLSMAQATREAGLALIISRENGPEAAVVQGVEAYAAENLAQVVEHLTGRQALAPVAPALPDLEAEPPRMEADFREVRGRSPRNGLCSLPRRAATMS